MTPPDPGPIMAMWAAGIAATVALVAWWQVVRRGFVLLGAGVTLLIGAAGAAVGAGMWAWVGSVLVVLALAPRAKRWAVLPLALAAAGYATAGQGMAGGVAGGVAAVTGALALGGVTAEMLLGHWYLVDPRLPRWALRNLAFLGLAGVAADAAVVWTSTPPDPFLSPLVLMALALTTALLLVGVILSLRVPSYTGVMAATGLSYLAVLTSLGAVVVGRAVIGFP